MKTKNSLLAVVIIVGFFILSGCGVHLHQDSFETPSGNYVSNRGLYLGPPETAGDIARAERIALLTQKALGQDGGNGEGWMLGAIYNPKYPAGETKPTTTTIYTEEQYYGEKLFGEKGYVVSTTQAPGTTPPYEFLLKPGLYKVVFTKEGAVVREMDLSVDDESMDEGGEKFDFFINTKK